MQSCRCTEGHVQSKHAIYSPMEELQGCSDIQSDLLEEGYVHKVM